MLELEHRESDGTLFRDKYGGINIRQSTVLPLISDISLEATVQRTDAIKKFAVSYGTFALEALWENYAYEYLAHRNERRGWLICGPASIMLSRKLSERFDVPVGRVNDYSEYKNTCERIEVMGGIYDPRAKAARRSRQEVMDHFYVVYHTGTGIVDRYDLTYRPYFDGVRDIDNAITAERFSSSEEMSEVLASKYAIYPLTSDHPLFERLGLLSYNDVPDSEELEDLMESFHEDRYTWEFFKAVSGNWRHCPTRGVRLRAAIDEANKEFAEAA